MKLTQEQKDHLKIMHRANMRIEETWSLFTMYLSQDKKPAEALQLAREAVDVWAEWMDDNQVEPPEIEQPDFGEQMKEAMGQFAEKMPQMFRPGMFPMPPYPSPLAGIDAEFAAHPETPEPGSQKESQKAE